MPKLDCDVQKLVEDIEYLFAHYEILDYADDDLRVQQIIKRIRKLNDYRVSGNVN